MLVRVLPIPRRDRRIVRIVTSGNIHATPLRTRDGFTDSSPAPRHPQRLASALRDATTDTQNYSPFIILIVVMVGGTGSSPIFYEIRILEKVILSDDIDSQDVKRDYV